MGVSRHPPPPKWPFFAQKWPNNANFGQEKFVFFWLGWSFLGPPTLFCRCLTQKDMCSKVWQPENGCFRATPPQKKWPFSAEKWPKNANFG